MIAVALEDISYYSSDNDIDDENEEEDDESDEELEKALLAHVLRVENIPSEDDPLIPRPPTTPKSVEESLEDYFHDQVFESVRFSQYDFS